MPGYVCSTKDVQRVKDALRQNPLNLGVGVLHEPSGQIILAPFDDVPGGHVDLVVRSGLPVNACKGFVICIQPGDVFIPVNASHLNGPLGTPGSLQMPSTTFADIVQALGTAGL